MPQVVDYDAVVQQMTAQGMRSLYYNSGAFGFAEGTNSVARGWIGPDDSTIRPAARALTTSVPAPYVANLARLAVQVWRNHLPGDAWVMPKSHWSYELDFGSPTWLPATLTAAGVDPVSLLHRNNAAAIAFSPAEANQLIPLLESLLTNLLGSDFTIVFPHRPAICTVHHHKQLWWQTSDPDLLARIDSEFEKLR